MSPAASEQSDLEFVARGPMQKPRECRQLAELFVFFFQVKDSLVDRKTAALDPPASQHVFQQSFGCHGRRRSICADVAGFPSVFPM
jgi:hypothetical protein